MSNSTGSAAYIRSSVLGPIVRVLDNMQVDTDRLLARQNLTRAQLHDPYSAVLLHRYVAFLEAAAKLTGDAGLGLRVGAMLQPADLGPAGLLFSMVPTLRQALQYLSRYLATLQSGTKLTLQSYDGWAALTYRIEDPSIWPRVQDSELTLSTMCSLIRSRAGAEWAPLEVHFDHGGRPADILLRQIFRAPVRFRQAVSQIILASADLDRPLRPADAEVMPALERHADDLLVRARISDDGTPATLTGRVRQLVAIRLGQDRHSVAEIANELGLSSRSLQRGLAAEGCTVRGLVRDYRRQLAEARLEETDASMTEIAHAMGYSDGTVFWRAYKNWSGSSPNARRRRGKDVL